MPAPNQHVPLSDQSKQVQDRNHEENQARGEGIGSHSHGYLRINRESGCPMPFSEPQAQPQRYQRASLLVQLRVEFKGLPLVSLGMFPVALLGIGQASVVVGQGVVRVEPDGLRVVVDGLVEVIQGDPGVAPVTMSQGMVRVEAQGHVVVADGLLVLAFFPIGQAPFEIRSGVVRVEARASLKSVMASSYSPWARQDSPSLR